MRRGFFCKKTLLWCECFFLIAGFICLGWVGFSTGQAFFYQSYESYQLQQSIAGKASSITGYIRSLFKRETVPVRPPVEATHPFPTEPRKTEEPPNPDRGLIGRVEIPRLDISAIVREGVDSNTLRQAVGHVPNTAFPGDPGNVGIAAHRDTFFRNVRNIRKGDRVMMVTRKGTFEYTVDSLKIVAPTDVRVLDPTPVPVITLVTCYPFNYIGSAPKRFIVRARLTSTEAKLAPPSGGS
jgi:sortase A